MAATEGPYVQVACFCDQVIEDKTGSFSLIRVVDLLTHSEVGPNPPERMPALTYRLKLVLMFKSGRAQGRAQMKVTPELPTGETESPLTFPIHFEGEEKGANVVVDFAYVFRYEGLYWFKIFIDSQLMTSIPLRVRYNPIVMPEPSADSPTPPSIP